MPFIFLPRNFRYLAADGTAAAWLEHSRK